MSYVKHVCRALVVFSVAEGDEISVAVVEVAVYHQSAGMYSKVPILIVPGQKQDFFSTAYFFRFA